MPGWDLASLRGFHAYLLALVVLVTLALWRIVRSPFGHVLRGIHENEARMEALGYAVDRYKLLAFVIAGIVAGVAGSLDTQFNGSITPGQHASFLGQSFDPLFISQDPNSDDFRLPELSLPPGITTEREYEV